MAVSGNTKPWGIPGINPLNADIDRFYLSRRKRAYAGTEW